MGLYEHLPYTNIHNLNEDWILREVNKALGEWAATKTEWNATKEEWNTLYNYVHDYFNNLDVTEEVRLILNDMAESGDLEPLIREALTIVTGDMSARMDLLESRMDEFSTLPEGSTTGDAELHDIRVAFNGKTYPNAGDSVRRQARSAFNSLGSDNVLNLTDYAVINNKTQQGITFTWQPDGSCYVEGLATGTAFCNMFSSEDSLPLFIKPGDLLELSNNSNLCNLRLYDYTDGSLTLLHTVTKSNSPKFYRVPESMEGMLVRIDVSNGTNISDFVRPVVRKAVNLSHVSISPGTAIKLFSDANDININSVLFVNNTGREVPDILNVPYAAAWIETNVITNDIIFQRLMPFSKQRPVMYRIKQFGTWTDWYTISPYINSVDIATADESAKTDCRALIQSALDIYGYCKLGPGVFYISNYIKMPEGSTLEGCGAKTEIMLKSGRNKYCVHMSKLNTVKDLSLIGSFNDLTDDDFTDSSGTRYGIFFRKAGESFDGDVDFCTIQNVVIKNFEGSAIYQYNTSGNVGKGLFVSNCKISNCWCGINIYSGSEYCRYENLQITYCYIACINNGGNNAFNNCVFHAYNTGMKIVGSMPNSAHGSVSNSAFCHIGSNRGKALDLYDIAYGFLFSSVQFWYNDIVLNNCSGVVFGTCAFGRGTGGAGQVINITDGGGILFNGCMFNNDITFPPVLNITGNDKVTFIACMGSQSGDLIVP